MKRHIPVRRPLGNTTIKTYCGRVVSVTRCIDLDRDCIEDAECKSCQRSDDRRVIEEYRLETKDVQ